MRVGGRVGVIFKYLVYAELSDMFLMLMSIVILPRKV